MMVIFPINLIYFTDHPKQELKMQSLGPGFCLGAEGMESLNWKKGVLAPGFAASSGVEGSTLN